MSSPKFKLEFREGYRDPDLQYGDTTRDGYKTGYTYAIRAWRLVVKSMVLEALGP